MITGIAEQITKGRLVHGAIGEHESRHALITTQPGAQSVNRGEVQFAGERKIGVALQIDRRRHVVFIQRQRLFKPFFCGGQPASALQFHAPVVERKGIPFAQHPALDWRHGLKMKPIINGAQGGIEAGHFRRTRPLQGVELGRHAVP